MALLTILEAPNPILSKRAVAVAEHEFNSELAEFVSNMAETMYAAPGVGLAAPQVGDLRRILVANLKGDIDEGSDEELIVMINPVVVDRSEKMIEWNESCLSVPDFDLDVDRHFRIHVKWKDIAGDDQEGVFEEFAAVVLQHEMDHLDGDTLLDRTSRLKRSRYVSRRKKMLRKQKG